MKAVISALGRNLTADEIIKLRRAYSRIPPVPGCKGLCSDSCTNAPLHPVEAYYLIENYGAKIEVAIHPANDPGSPHAIALPTLGVNFSPCQFLDSEKRCSIYEDRPLVCRLFGHPALTLGCVHGCGSGSTVTDELCAELMYEAMTAFDGFAVQEGENIWGDMIRTVGEMEAEREEAEEGADGGYESAPEV